MSYPTPNTNTILIYPEETAKRHLALALPCSNKGTKTHTAEILFSRSASHKVPLTPTAIDSSTCTTKSSAPMIEYEDSSSSATSRAAIASKRAAQNRAAQRAFRQRREQYVKDLERRVKEMATWPEEIEHLRFENNHLKEHVSILLRRISELTSQQMTPPLSSASSAGSCDAVE
ncbi:hypothetical protein K492DRAFT_185388 [Lichtheimia hyalospora FSU 10163]|nr:hypothetical protein K492DRAFT_185388 [Lichtheimia hyalospora FSU 10163]